MYDYCECSNRVVVTLGQTTNMRELFHVIDIVKSPPKKATKYLPVFFKNGTHESNQIL